MKRPFQKTPGDHHRENRKPHFVQLFTDVSRSPAFETLPGSAVKVWVKLRSSYNGRNNGELFLPLESTAKALHLSKSTVARALPRLASHGLIAKVKKGSFYFHRSSTWRFTDLPAFSKGPTHEWREWEKTKHGICSGPLQAHHGTVRRSEGVATGSPQYRFALPCASATVPPCASLYLPYGGLGAAGWSDLQRSLARGMKIGLANIRPAAAEMN